ncbi:MAG: hypothetical protein JXC31_01460 [Acholeplasmataceae bacterium]|nr:hypothetical protein [Acholeplasmataceae bacterium]
MKINHFLVFIPTKDFEHSKSFYQDIGFDMVWADNDLARFRKDGAEFFLQGFYDKGLGDNLMFHLNIDNFDETYQNLSDVCKRYPECYISKPKDEYYGRAFKLRGPSGELWDIVKGTQG